MALFFDAPWFDGKLAERSLSRAVLAAVAGLSEADLALVFKDQRELSAGQVAAFAELLGVSAEEVADRAGVSTPTPPPDAAGEGAAGENACEPDGDRRIAALERRVAALEAELVRLLARQDL
ncbi:DNA-binding protein [Phenylobacterium sp.]|uniref:DNA-binding protein n=1 Tax=Phenylobacterium sp. TaxID=1871053 RepID=UPI00301E057A